MLSESGWILQEIVSGLSKATAELAKRRRSPPRAGMQVQQEGVVLVVWTMCTFLPASREDRAAVLVLLHWGRRQALSDGDVLLWRSPRTAVCARPAPDVRGYFPMRSCNKGRVITLARYGQAYERSTLGSPQANFTS